MRIVLDTNVLVSTLVSAGKAPAQILARCQAGELDLLVSPDSLAELRRVLAYPRIRKRLQYSDEQIERFISNSDTVQHTSAAGWPERSF
jgi:putative PIN family toxin of toxin-antitoxin system